jgi:periplasmic protein TonB
MPGRRDTAQYASDGTALVLTAVAAAVILASAHNLPDRLLARAGSQEPAIELTVQLAQPETPPAPPPPPQPPRVKTHRAILQPAPEPVDPLPVENEPVPVDAVPVAAYVPAPAPAAETRPDLEAQYAATLYADIDRRKHPPDSPQYRLHHPSGEVRVGFTILRSGASQGVTVERSSGSAILDQEALRLVASGQYPAMPAKAFVGQAQHRFAITIAFPPALAAR